jgi:hypothetical protein
MAVLAIRGHATRGKEVIEILEMLGGKNRFYYDGTYKDLIYIIGSELELDVLNIYFPGVKDRYIIFTLEEFLEKYPYKVGDTVLYEHDDKIFFIRKMFWENDKILYELSDEVYSDGCSMPDTLIFDVDVVKLQPYKKETMEKEKKYYDEWLLTDYLEFEDNDDVWADEVEVNLGKDYEIQIRGDKTFIVKKKSQYPKTYEECHKLMVQWKEYDCNPNSELILCEAPIHDFCKLIVARNIYWKIAGEQMGLGKPWEPDWLNTEQDKFVLYTHNNVICLNRFVLGHNVLAFPTAEMRDAFLENFKDLIELCKELL